MAAMLMVDTRTLVAAIMDTNLQRKAPRGQEMRDIFIRLNGCVKRQRMRSDTARFVMKMLRGVRMWGRLATT